MELEKPLSLLFGVTSLASLLVLLSPVFAAINGFIGSVRLAVAFWLVLMDLVILLYIFTGQVPTTDDLFLAIMFAAQALIAILLLFFPSSGTSMLLMGALLLACIISAILLWLSSDIPKEEKSILGLLQMLNLIEKRQEKAQLRHEEVIESQLDQAVERMQDSVDEIKEAIPEPEEDEEKLRISSINGKNFHRLTCLAMSRVSKESRRKFDSEEDAVDAGLKPCRICLPTTE